MYYPMQKSEQKLDLILFFFPDFMLCQGHAFVLDQVGVLPSNINNQTYENLIYWNTNYSVYFDQF